MADDTPLVVAAIDFGSHGSGYAFSFFYEFRIDPINISTPRWSADSGSGTSYKAPSCILLDNQKKLVAFGHDAEDQYTTICERSEQNSFYYLKQFKMKLYQAVKEGKDINSDFEIREENGKTVKAKKVFSLAIKYLKKHLLGEFKERNLCFERDRIKWVITVPAIWNDACKQFMREAAEKAGIARNKFCIVYEPEAASIYARLLPVEKFVGKNEQTLLRTFEPGKKLIVIDAGGGTVDISVQEVLPDLHLRIIDKVRGGSWGGEWINQEYRKFLISLVGGDVFTKFKRNHGLDYNEMMRTFETRKKDFRGNESSTISTRFPGSLADILENETECSLPAIIENSSLKDKVKTKRDKLFINKEKFESFFSESIQLTVNEMKEVLSNDRCSDVSAVMLVGGFAECRLLQHAVKKELDLEVFIPVEGGLSVLKGAVIYGHDPNIITSRVCTYTYGVSISVPFKEDIHPRSKFYRHDGEDWCKHIFHVCFEEGSEVKVGDKAMIELNNTFENDETHSGRTKPLTVEIYISDQKNPKFVTDPGCSRHAIINVDPPNGMWPIFSFGYVELEVSGTEMVGTYVFAKTGERHSTSVQFLPSGYKFLKGERERIFHYD